MITYSESLAILTASARDRRLPVEWVPLDQTLGRVVGQEVRGAEAIPGFDNSAMDGFAVSSEATQMASAEHPVRLRVLGTIMAGDRITERPGTRRENCFEIMTGAPMPEGGRAGALNAVVKIEDVVVHRASDGRPESIELKRALKPFENVRERGEDFAEGQTIFRPGTQLAPEHLMAAASLGLAKLPVIRRPRLAFLSTGDELVPYTTRELEPGQIRNSTAPYLVAAGPRFGAECRTYGVVGDSPEDFLKRLHAMTDDGADVIVTTGAVSMGKCDFIKEALEHAGALIRYHKVAIRPGKPGLFAELPSPGRPVVFGVPGNPISTVVGLRFFISPYLRMLAGQPAELPLRARLAAPAPKPEGLRCFFKARLECGPEASKVTALHGQPSFMVSSLLEANAWVVFPEAGREAVEGTEVDVYPIFPTEDR